MREGDTEAEGGSGGIHHQVSLCNYFNFLCFPRNFTCLALAIVVLIEKCCNTK